MALTREDLIMQLFTELKPVAGPVPAMDPAIMQAEALDLISEIAQAVDGQRGGSVGKAPLKYVEEFLAGLRPRKAV